jgi:1-deoxy-D-xylulose-5-phosphate reductoisomerase
MSDVRTLAILGSTGSIGRQAVEVALLHRDRVRVIALAARSSARLIMEQAHALGCRRVALAEPSAAADAASGSGDIVVQAGADAVADAAQGADVVLNALVGSAGLEATLRALDSGSRLALANKESLVAGGPLVTNLVRGDNLIPVDSEHSAILQCLVGEDAGAISRLWLTASGGPFRGASASRLSTASLEETLAHPRWTMGPKITVDSATLMNKGLEVIEAHHLFDLDYDDIRVVVHPQSCIHSMVEFSDGSVKAHLGATDMRVPIQYAISYPERWDPPCPPVDFARQEPLTFEPPDVRVFGCLELAYEAGRAGGTLPAVLNAANEEAVAAFLASRLSLDGVESTVRSVMAEHTVEPLDSLDRVERADAWARARARELLS